MKKKIIEMSKPELISFKSQYANYPLSQEEIRHIVEEFGVIWRYDYAKAQGSSWVGCHAELKSGNHSDLFFNFGVLFRYNNLMNILAKQLVWLYQDLVGERPDWVAGIPNGAIAFGAEVARSLGSRPVDLRKENNGRIVLKSRICPTETVLLVDDVFTKGTAFNEVAREIWRKQPRALIIRGVLAFMNRGVSVAVEIDGESCEVISLVKNRDRVNEWLPEECPLCKNGSRAIKPRESLANWIFLTASQ